MDLDQREAVYVHEVIYEAVKQMDVGERGKQKTRLCFNSNTKVIQISRIILSLPLHNLFGNSKRQKTRINSINTESWNATPTSRHEILAQDAGFEI